jgi:hypothetical protein
MNNYIRQQLWDELQAHGYSSSGNAPNKSMWLDDEFLAATELVELIDLLISRREKIYKAVEIVGEEQCKLNYVDVAIAVDAIKAVISRNLSEGST